MPGAYERKLRTHLQLAPVPGVPELNLYRAHSGSRISELVDDKATPPYWAWAWAGGLALARYILDHPEKVAGKRILDYGAGGGVVAIAAGKAGADCVCACERDTTGQTVLRLNAEANGVVIGLWNEPDDTPPPVDLVVAGDVFYDTVAAAQSVRFFDLCAKVGIEVLISDPGRRDLPTERLSERAVYQVTDFGLAEGSRIEARVFGWRLA